MSDHILIAAIQQKDQQIKKLEEEVLLYEVVAEIERMEASEAKQSKRVRSSERTEVIEAAIRAARTPDNAHSILDALRTLARERRYPQLIGYVPNEGFQWVTGPDEEPKYQLDKDALAAIRRHLQKRLR